MKPIYIGTNTKMFKTCKETREYLAALSGYRAGGAAAEDRLELFVIPSYTSLHAAGPYCGKGIRLGAQNMSWEDRAALTGEVSPLMLREAGVEIVELGHSERRHILGETDGQINAKVSCAFRHGFTSLLCVGETEQQRDDGISDEILRIQLKVGLKNLPSEIVSRLWVAYEPVWAIGEGGTPASREYAEEKHQLIARTLCELYTEAARQVPILYGGSINPGNAPELIQMPHIDGLFIGRSAWDAEQFSGIIDSVLHAGGMTHGSSGEP